MTLHFSARLRESRLLRRAYRSVVVVLAGAVLMRCTDSTGPSEPSFTHPSGTSSIALPISGRPHGVSIAPGGRLYVSQIDGNAITRGTVDANGQSVSGSV